MCCLYWSPHKCRRAMRKRTLRQRHLMQSQGQSGWLARTGRVACGSVSVRVLVEPNVPPPGELGHEVLGQNPPGPVSGAAPTAKNAISAGIKSHNECIVGCKCDAQNAISKFEHYLFPNPKNIWVISVFVQLTSNRIPQLPIRHIKKSLEMCVSTQRCMVNAVLLFVRSPEGSMSKTDGSQLISASRLPAASQQRSRSTASSLRAKQCKKIAELRESLVQAGLYSLDEQAAALNLSRSTAWAVLRGTYKASGLSAKLIKRMLASPQLPPEARTRIGEYVEEKLAGSFGHSEKHTRLFKMRIAQQDQRS
jgi:hypothetical protein